MPVLPDALERARELPLGITLPAPFFLGMVAWYNLVAPRWTSERKRAYVLSCLSALTMTLASLPFLYAYVSGGILALWTAGQEGWTKTLQDIAVAWFGTYLLVIGYVAYKNEVGMLTGWIHHSVYLVLMVYCARTPPMSCIFLLAAVMELPTFDLGLSSLFPQVRSDERFLALMMTTRIMFNAWILVDFTRPTSRAITGGSLVPTVMLALALALHVSWMHGGVTGYLRRRTKVATDAKVAQQAADVVVASGEDTPFLVPATPALDPMTPSLSPTTPDESPLVTPRTPGQAATSIRDNFFPNIPIPTMPNLPIPAIPTLSDMAAALPQAKANLNQLQFGLTEAVNRRWEEQREKLAAHRGALAARGEALLRRRRWESGEDDE
ncbi:hypothetical protein CspeluHIS016_0106220 [Cutaneotrichosporon spelunceum]|uniref:TLC domain-containing protein n=1 Tax=Cutaneotrichosporon spelunceum TaxID=1672016 RepID=A0AAD3Y8B5_9TREE|nr:hypothetical protein CspeluHIS016_0106220 [Cutaneotrichosporon spelunceum]